MSRYEIHLTVAAAAADEPLRALAAALGGKYTRIELGQGEHPSQPMLSWLSDGTPATAEPDAQRRAAALRDEGFPVTRAPTGPEAAAGTFVTAGRVSASLPPAPARF
ncbi:hypothetical protein AB0F72_31295 [Actinoplanes sp. NPDC023936]|uniref:hypothetical protein n=1 Tax=Actinoplanes sp. NPDC023936 TaxID=3154910 RepID=UPI0033D75859